MVITLVLNGSDPYFDHADAVIGCLLFPVDYRVIAKDDVLILKTLDFGFHIRGGCTEHNGNLFRRESCVVLNKS